MKDDLITWIKQVLSNDEASSDKEILDLFVKEGNLTRDDAEYWVKQRNKYLNASPDYNI